MIINRFLMWAIFGTVANFLASAVVTVFSFLLSSVAVRLFGQQMMLYFWDYETWLHSLPQIWWLGIAPAIFILLVKPPRVFNALILGICIYTGQSLLLAIYYKIPITFDLFVSFWTHISMMGVLCAASLWWQGKRTDWQLVSIENTTQAQSFTKLSRKRNAFTLVEILIFITIIGILAGLLFPAFQKSRAQARKASCVSNLHQLGLAVQLYQQDYNCDGQLYPVPAKVNILVKDYAKSPTLLVCPLDATTRGYGNSTEIFQTSAYRNSYGYLGTRYAQWTPDLTDLEFELNEQAKFAFFGCQLHGEIIPVLPVFAFGADGVTEAEPFEEVALYQGLRLRLMADGHVKTDHHSYLRPEGGITTLGSLDDSLKDFNGE